MKTFKIYHPDHGEANADDSTDLEAFKAAGWSTEKPVEDDEKDDEKDDQDAKPSKPKKAK